MTFDIEVRVNGLPKPQPRPRAFAKKFQGKDGVSFYTARVYEAGTAEAWKGDVIRALEQHKPEAPLEGPIGLEIDFYIKRPKKYCRKKDPDGLIYCIAKPDRDNLEKAVTDAMKVDGWFRDDCQIVSGPVQKFYHEKDGCPGARIRIYTIQGVSASIPYD